MCRKRRKYSGRRETAVELYCHLCWLLFQKKKKEKSQCVVTCSDVIYFEDLEGLALLSKVAFQSFFLAQLCVGNSAWPEEMAANSDH